MELSKEGVEQLLKGVSIPPRPTLLIEVDRELKKADPDMKRVAELIAKDVGVSAAMLKTLNSPLFALRSKVGNVAQAVMMLGARNVQNIVTGLVLRNALGGAAASLERFWDSAEKVASINAYICTVLPKAPRDEAYTFGLFRDCGIPLLMQRFPEYRETLKKAAGEDVPLVKIEDECHGTNHATVGYMVARSWGLSDTICQAIRCHHELDVITGVDAQPPLTRMLVVVNFLAEHLNDTALRMRGDHQWETIGSGVLDYLGLTENEYQDLTEDVVSICA
ncbi:MAG: HDOD domain-containing protein [Rhodocyclaceae bacterium]|nr:HDOD domain-containing protein [Rhodocyclaceae bacterium]